MQITEFDFFVIGGGSGGIAAAKQAAQYGVKVGLADFVQPSGQGTKWDLGGTCVNVGCIPKKLMHFAAQAGDLRADQVEAGWTGINVNGKHDWNKMVENVQNHIQKLNVGYKNQLLKKGVTYFNKFAEFEKNNILKLTDHTGIVQLVKAKHVLIAVGGRPTYPDNIPNIEKMTITSDDLFSLGEPPGKVLIIGASYVALECGGFLKGLGYDTSIMVRSILLRGFDQQMVGKIDDFMVEKGIKFIREATPMNIEMIGSRRKVTWIQYDKQLSDIFDTVLVATGRRSDTNKLNLQKVGVKTNKNGKIICTIDDKTTINNIYAIGDCVEGRPELTPTAIKCGQLLADRLFGGSKKFMCYQFIPTTIFTPLEYSCIGFSEEDALEKFGKDEIIIYHSIFKPLEWNFLESHYAQACMTKQIILKSTRRVIGLHYLGPNAGEVIQGYAVAMKLGASKEQFDATVGIHPTCSEEIVTLTAIKGIDNPQKEGC